MPSAVKKVMVSCSVSVGSGAASSPLGSACKVQRCCRRVGLRELHQARVVPAVVCNMLVALDNYAAGACDICFLCCQGGTVLAEETAGAATVGTAPCTWQGRAAACDICSTAISRIQQHMNHSAPEMLANNPQVLRSACIMLAVGQQRCCSRHLPAYAHGVSQALYVCTLYSYVCCRGMHC
jgi:hypothetical protein